VAVVVAVIVKQDYLAVAAAAAVQEMELTLLVVAVVVQDSLQFQVILLLHLTQRLPNPLAVEVHKVVVVLQQLAVIF
jgi:hypothetical protein